MLARFERLMEQAIEGGLRRVFPTTLQPVQLAKAAARAMEQSQTIGVRGPEVANQYEVHVAAADLQRFGDYRETLCSDVRGYLVEYARERGLKPKTDIGVDLIEDSRVRTGDVRAVARYVDLAPQEERALQEAVAATRRLRLEDLASARAARPPAPSGTEMYLSDGSGLVFGLDPQLEVVRLGRALDNDVVADSQRVSRYHAQVRWVDSAWLVYDLNSTNGTWLNKDRVDPHRPLLLQVGSQLRLGDVDLEVTRKPPQRGQH